MNKLIFLSILYCSTCFAESPSNLAKTEVKKFGKIYLKPNGFTLLVDGGHLMDGIHRIDIIFEKKEYVNIDQARIDLVLSIENFLSFINKTKAKKYFDTFPMTERDLYIHISYVTKPWEPIKDHKHIGYAIQCKEKMSYELCNEGLTPSTVIYTETYAEAYEKVYGVPISERPWMKEYCQKQKDI
jgi:hypothetical protein